MLEMLPMFSNVQPQLLPQFPTPTGLHGDASGYRTVPKVCGEPEFHTELLRAHYTCQGLLAWRKDHVAVGDATRRGIFVARGVEMWKT